MTSPAPGWEPPVGPWYVKKFGRSERSAAMASLLTTVGSCSSASVITLELRCARDGDGAAPAVVVFAVLLLHETARTSRAATQIRVFMEEAPRVKWRVVTRGVLLRGGEQHENG